MNLARIDGKAACWGNVQRSMHLSGPVPVADCPPWLYSGEHFWDARKAEKMLAKWRGSSPKGGLCAAATQVREKYGCATIAG
jgi:hypothetical protein